VFVLSVHILITSSRHGAAPFAAPGDGQVRRTEPGRG